MIVEGNLSKIRKSINNYIIAETMVIDWNLLETRSIVHPLSLQIASNSRMQLMQRKIVFNNRCMMIKWCMICRDMIINEQYYADETQSANCESCEIRARQIEERRIQRRR